MTDPIDHAADARRALFEERAAAARADQLRDQSPPRVDEGEPSIVVVIELEDGTTRQHECVGRPTLLNGFLHLDAVQAGQGQTTYRRVSVLVSRLISWTEEENAPGNG